MTASASGFRPYRQIIKRSFDDLTVRLRLENRNGSLVLSGENWLSLPPVEWYLDGLPFGESLDTFIEGKSVGISNLLTGFYEITVRRGERVLLYQDEMLVLEGSEIEL